jgi:Flp pilus assembly pilin Flp
MAPKGRCKEAGSVLSSATEREEGVTAVEYALMVAIIAVLLVGAFYALFNSVLDRYSSVATCVDSGPLPGACAPDPDTGAGTPPGGG